MPAGKLAAQAGHAYLESFFACQNMRPETAEAYRNDPPGTKITLAAPSLEKLLDAYEQCKNKGIPCALITDEHHILPPHFDGKPIITALGIGPTLREESGSITNSFAKV